MQCVQTGTGALTGLWLRDGVAWLTFWLRRCTHAGASWFLAAFWWNRCKTDLNSFPRRKLDETTGTSSYYMDETHSAGSEIKRP